MNLYSKLRKAAAAACLGLSAAIVHAAPTTQPTRPNVILITADDLGYGDISCYRQDPANTDSPIFTPHIDALAAQGVKFTRAYAMPMCSPSRAALLTGRFPQRYGFYGNADSHVGLPKDQVMLSQLMKDAGYATGMVGKWHVGNLEGYRPLERGFERFYGFLGAAHDYFKPNIGTDTDGPYYPDSWVWDQDQKVEKFNYLTDQFTDVALQYIDQQHKAGKPFFLYLPFSAPHGPEQAKPEAIDEFRRVPGTKNKARTVVRAMIDSLDQNIGRLDRELFLRGLDKNTIVIFASDNGGNEYEEPTGLRSVTHNGGLRGRKFTLWEGGIRVPMIVRYPGRVPKGAVYDKPVMLLDAYAIAAAAAGAEVPKDRKMDAVDLLPFVGGQKTGSPHGAIHFMMPETSLWTVIDGDWKLIYDRDSVFLPKNEKPPKVSGLYNLAEDPAERNNLMDKHPEKVAELTKLHEQFMSECRPSIAEAKKVKSIP